MKFIIILAVLQLISFSCFGLEQRDKLNGKELFDLADSVAIIRLTGGDYLRGIGDSYELRGEVLTTLKGKLGKSISYSDGYDYSEPCFKRTLGSFYIIFLKSKHTLWATASSFEVEGGPKFWFGHEVAETDISKNIDKKYSKEAYFGDQHVWFVKNCPGVEEYNQLMESVLSHAFHKAIQPTTKASSD